MITTTTTEERDHAVRRLQAILPPGSEIGTVTRYGRGATDYVEAFAVDDGRIIRISYYVARACGYRLTENGIPMRGYGYSKPVELVQAVGQYVQGDRSAYSLNRLLG